MQQPLLHIIFYQLTPPQQIVYSPFLSPSLSFDMSYPYYTRCAWAGGTFFQLCCCVSFWFWREICFGFTYYYLCTQSTIQLWCCVSFLTLAGNSFWCYVRTQCTIQLCGCVVFWLWQEIILKMRTRFYKKILLGYFIMIRSFLKNIKTFLCKQKLVNNHTIPSKQQFNNHDSFSKISRPSTA